MRVLLVNDLPPGPRGGAEVHVARLARALAASGDTVETFFPAAPHRGVAKALDVWDPSARRALRRRARRFAPDVVHHHNVLRELSVSVLGVPRGVPTVMTVHDLRLVQVREGRERERHAGPVLGLKALKGRLDRSVVRRRVDVLVAVSATVERRLRAAGFPRVRTVRNFADAVDCGPVAAGRSILCAGQLARHKGVDVLLAAFAKVVTAHPDASLVIAGEGPERARLEALAAELAPDRVRFVGLVDEPAMRALLGEARVVCSPVTRLTEGAGLVLIEAMLAGRPVVATDVPSFREILADGELGVIVPMEDPDALADALDRLLRDDAEAQRLADAGRAAATATYTAEASVATLHDVYREAIARRA